MKKTELMIEYEIKIDSVLNWDAIPIGYAKYLESELIKARGKASTYDRLMSGRKDTKGWINIEHEPKHTGYYMVIANVASEFGGYKGVVPAHYNTHANHWLFAFDLIGSVIAYKPFPKMPDGWEEK